MTNWTISTKLFTLAAIGGVGSIALLGWLSVTQGTSALLERGTNSLEAVRRSRQGYLENYFGIIREQIFNFAQDEMIVDAVGSKNLLDAAALPSSMAMGSSMSEDKMRVMKGRGTPRCP